MSTVNLENKTILVTGVAGFIGSNLVKRICEERGWGDSGECVMK